LKQLLFPTHSCYRMHKCIGVAFPLPNDHSIEKSDNYYLIKNYLVGIGF
jgi:hypothetical protein